MNIDKEIDTLLKSFGLYYIDTVYDKCNQAELLLKSLFKKNLAGKTLAFRGGGETACRLINLMENKNSLKYIIDRNPDNLYGGIPIISPDEGKNVEVDCLVITSYKYGTLMKQEYSEFCGEIIDIYEYLNQKGLFLKSVFFSYDVRQNYVEIFYDKQSFEKETDLGKKKYYLMRLISRYVNIRDFVNAEKNLLIYKDMFDSSLEEFRLSLWGILGGVKEKLAERKQKDLLVFWIDQMRFQDLDRTCYMKNLKGETLYFENAFTQNLQTSTTMLNMFTGKDLVDDRLYCESCVTKENSRLYKLLCQNGYDFRYIGIGTKQVRVQQVDTYQCEKNHFLLPMNCWKLSMDLLQNQGKSMYICHSFEVHEPHYCGDTQNIGDDIKKLDFVSYQKRYYDCLDYVDKQFAWYDKFLCCPDCHKIIMSDHGQGLIETYEWEKQEGKFPNGRWHDDALHTVLIVKTPLLKPRLVQGLFSLEQFSELIETLLCNQWKIQDREYVKIQSLPFYLESNLEIIKKVDDIRYGMMVLGIRTLTEKYIRYQDGVEAYYLLPDEKNNKINDKENIERIDKLRKLIKGDFDELFEHKKFQRAREVLCGESTK